MRRHLVLFAREPRQEARRKGFSSSAAAELFATFAAGWADAARRAGARLVVAAPGQDRSGWQRSLGDTVAWTWIPQRGPSFGARLESVARAANALGGHAVLVGGDVVPSAGSLLRAFEALERGVPAVLAPAGDGGFSMVGFGDAGDLDILRAVRLADAKALLAIVRCLQERGRGVELVMPASDVDGRRGLRSLVRLLPKATPLRSLARLASSSEAQGRPLSPPPVASVLQGLGRASGLRAPPPAA